jgi:hypothetical protein
LTAFARSLPSSYQLLPEYACLAGEGDALLKTTECELPRLDGELIADGMRFHEELDAAYTGSYPVVPVVGIGQPTWTTATLVDTRIKPLATIGGRDLAGDGTVPRLSARPKRLEERDPSLRGVGEGHGSLAVHQSVLDQLDFMLSAEDIAYRAPDLAADEGAVGVSVADLHDVGETVEVNVRTAEPRVLEALAVDERSDERARELVRFGGEIDEAGRGVGTASFESLDPGGYTVVVRAPDDPMGVELQPVRATTLVWAD